MSWRSRIQTEWKGAGIIERISWIFTIGLPVVAWTSGYLPMFKDNTFVIFSILSYALLIVVVALNISMRKERDDAKKKLTEEKETAKTSREFSDKIIETDREQFEQERSKLAEALRIEQNKASQSEKYFVLMKYAYDKSNEKFDKLDMENQKLTGKYVLKAGTGHFKITGGKANLEKQTVVDRMKSGDLSDSEAYEIATSQK